MSTSPNNNLQVTSQLDTILCDICNEMVQLDTYLAHLTECSSPENESWSEQLLPNLFNPYAHFIDIINNRPSNRYQFNIMNNPNNYEDESESSKQGLDRKVHSTCYTLVMNNKEDEPVECPVCLTVHAELRQYLCRHYLCAYCSDRWFSEHTKCPLCNKDFSLPAY